MTTTSPATAGATFSRCSLQVALYIFLEGSVLVPSGVFREPYCFLEAFFVSLIDSMDVTVAHGASAYSGVYGSELSDSSG